MTLDKSVIYKQLRAYVNTQFKAWLQIFSEGLKNCLKTFKDALSNLKQGHTILWRTLYVSLSSA